MTTESTSTKDTNPKDLIGITKPSMSSVSGGALLLLGAAMTEGHKYGRHNYRVSGVRAGVYYDAIWRHLLAWWEGEDIDPDSGLPHTAKAMACLAILVDAEMNGKLNDDRPPKLPADWMARMQEAFTGVFDNIKDKIKEPHTEK